MTRGGKVLSVMLVVLLGLWGCARGPVGNSAQTERIHTLETQCAKLKDDYHSVAGARDKAFEEVKALKAEQARLQKDLAERHRERDTLRQQVATCTSERDNLQLRCDRLKKGLQNLLGQDDAMLPAPAPTSTSSNSTPLPPTQS